MNFFDLDCFIVPISDIEIMRKNPKNLEAISTYYKKVVEAKNYNIIKRKLALQEAAIELYETCNKN